MCLIFAINATSEPLHNLNNPIHDDAVINNTKDELLCWKSAQVKDHYIEFTIRQTFSNREHFLDVLNEFKIVKNLSLKVLKHIVKGLLQCVGPRSACGMCTPVLIRVAKVSQS